MRKSKLYASVALAALLAACSNEDFISNEQQTPNLDGRPTTKVVLALDEADTRLDFTKPEGEGWQWAFEDGDKIGALLMDEWNKKGCGIDNFTLTDYVHTNYPFIRKTVNGETTWNTPEDAAVAEGNYFFYFPYDKTFTHRGLVGWSVNPDQKNYDPETGEYFAMQSIKDNQKWLGYKFIEHTTDGVNKVNFDFVPLFATPKFVFENMSSLDLQIERLVIRDNSNNSNNGINPSGEAKLLATSMMLAPSTGEFGDVNKTWESENYQSHTADMWLHAQRYISNDYDYPTDGAGKSMEIEPTSTVYTLNGVPADREATYEYTVDFGENYVVKNGDDIVARLVMPGGLYRTGKVVFEALLYVKNPANGKRYVVRVDLGNPQTQGGTQKSAWDDIIGDQANHFLRPGVMATFQTSFDANALQSYAITDFKAATTGELKWLLEESVKNTGAKDLIVTTFGKRVELNAEIAALLKENPQLRLSINGDITIAEDAPADAINLLYFYNENIKTNLHIAGEQVANKWVWTSANTNVTEESTTLGNCEIEVLKDGKLDTKTNGIKIEADVTNEGEVLAGDVEGNVINKSGAKFTADTVTGNITNSGDLNVNTKVDGNIVNEVSGIANVASTTENITNKGEMTLTGSEYAGKIVNNGKMTVAGDSEFTHATGDNVVAEDAALRNYGNLTFDANVNTTVDRVWFVNEESAEASIAEGKTIRMHRTDNSGTINVGEGAVLTPNKNFKGNVNNLKAGLINNNGTVHNVINNGKIVTGANSITNVTEGNGIIDNSAMGEVSYNDEQTVQFIVADVTGISAEVLNNNVKKADANQLIIEKGELKIEDNFNLNGGSKTCENRGYFGKGVIFGDVTVYAPMNKRLAVYTDGFTVNGKTEVNHGELVVLKGISTGTTATVEGELNISNYGTFRGTKDAKLTINFTDGFVHNQGTVKNITNKDNCKQSENNHWTGRDAAE